MPGFASWKAIFKDEHFQMYHEGFPVEDMTKYLNKTDESSLSEYDWENAYYTLIKVKENGIKPDFQYFEPNDYESIINEASAIPNLQKLTESEYTDRIKGAWFGRCAGVILGKPLEMGYDRLMVKKYLESVDMYPLSDFVPEYSEKLDIFLRKDSIPSTKGNVQYVQCDDDINYTILSLLIAEQYGFDFTTLNVGQVTIANVPYEWFWVADKQAYYHMVNLDYEIDLQTQVDEFPDKMNPWRECMDGELKADFWGYITPCNPRKGAYYAHKISSFSLAKNGLYGSMFIAGCISAALSKKPTVENIIAGGLSVIPKKSRLYDAVTNVVNWYRETPDWITVCDKIYEKYGYWYFAATINNLSWVTLALLHGDLDYEKTITTAVMCGTDTDCNSGTAASIVGAAIGYEKLPEKWITPLNDRVKTAVAEYGEGTITELCERTIKIRKEHEIASHNN